MSEALEWVRLFFTVLFQAAGVATSLLMLWVFYNIAASLWGFMSEGRHGTLPSFRVLMRRVYCRHRYLSRIKTRYGYRKTACSGCGKSINANKPRELWR